ncbi:YehS family protein [Haloplasma contractile]|uniref:Cytoplasmic protein n=1 Tax=Haloplasma contractile SSD-17B TaxID=1033810 RepID=F7Q0X8_9MOLU|nr:DUF1456 family protein [Haloplasma contractile]ERJ11357.1 Putative cytoplasmic protein [Haloplasma contractile SSD-17B]
MDNNDRLIRLRYALDIKDDEMTNIFKLGGTNVTEADVKKILSKESYEDEDYIRENTDFIRCTNEMLDSFLNGFITYKRGKQEDKPGKPKPAPLTITDDRHVNNVLLKKLKIALKLTSDDMHELFKKAGIEITNSELTAVLRREGQRNYKACGDRYARNFLKGLTIKYRK